MFPGCSLVSHRSSEVSECGKLIQVVDSGRSAKVSKSSGTDGKPTIRALANLKPGENQELVYANTKRSLEFS